MFGGLCVDDSSIVCTATERLELISELKPFNRIARGMLTAVAGFTTNYQSVAAISARTLLRDGLPWMGPIVDIEAVSCISDGVW